MYDPVYFREVTEVLDVFDDFVRAKNLTLPANYTVALDVNPDPDGSIVTEYYFADHDKRIIFFMDEWHAHEVKTWGEVKGVYSMAHLSESFYPNGPGVNMILMQALLRTRNRNPILEPLHALSFDYAQDTRRCQ